MYERPWARPAWQDELQQFQGVEKPADLRQALLRMVSSSALCSRAFITEQYDRYVRGNTVLAQNSDAGVLRIDETTGRGVAVSADASGRYTKLDPNTGARLALAEAYRNVAVTGATPVAVTNCLNFGSPENPDVMWQFREAVRGLADGCAELGIPVSGGNVSFYNQTGTEPILPTPVVGVLGVIDDVAERIGHTLGTVDGPEDLYVLGATFDEFGGSIWQQVSGGGLNGMPPAVDLANEQKLVELFSGPRVVTAAHDVSEGGLAQAVAELAMTSGDGVGVDIDVAAVHEDPFVALFSESASRAVVATTDGAALEARARELGIPCVKLGRTNADKQLRVAGQFDVPVAELREAWAGTLPEIFGHAVGANSVVE